MNDLKKLKAHYNKKGWVIYKNLFSLDEINSVNLMIKNFLKKKINSFNKKSRAINFTDDKKVYLLGVNNLIVVSHKNKILILEKGKSEKVKYLIDKE